VTNAKQDDQSLPDPGDGLVIDADFAGAYSL
jgi:hypothetical protein